MSASTALVRRPSTSTAFYNPSQPADRDATGPLTHGAGKPSSHFLEDRSTILQPVLAHASRIIRDHRDYELAVRASQVLLEAEEPSARTVSPQRHAQLAQPLSPCPA